MGRRNKVKLKRNDLFIGIYILSAVLFFIISIPSWLLDILLAFNIMVALVILFNSLFAKEVLDMASFPTMLLFTTIFRISLNVSSTKMILRDGYGVNLTTSGLAMLYVIQKKGQMNQWIEYVQEDEKQGFAVHNR